MRRSLKPALSRPRDFEAFWHRTKEQLASVEPCVQRQFVDGSEDRDLSLEYLAFHSFGGVQIHGYALSWRDERRRPLVVHSHGYGSACEIKWKWAQRGLNVVGVDIRGFGRSAAAMPQLSKWGYVLTGADTPETSILRGAVCDYMRAVEVARDLFGTRANCVVLHGGSFAGTLALLAEAIMQAANLLVVSVPSLGWAEGRFFFVKSGSGAEINRYLEERPESAEDLMLVLRYFDAMNFAGMVRCPSLVGVGLSDEVVPAKTVYAIANHLAGTHEIMEFPVSHSQKPEEALWTQFEERWLKLALAGVPKDFGRENSP